VQLNLKVQDAKKSGIHVVAKFPDIIFPIIWAEEVTLIT
jgi:hypothetical protein